jgi:CTP:phosphocholine cytidylyltransferase-like protein
MVDNTNYILQHKNMVFAINPLTQITYAANYEVQNKFIGLQSQVLNKNNCLLVNDDNQLTQSIYNKDKKISLLQTLVKLSTTARVE